MTSASGAELAARAPRALLSLHGIVKRFGGVVALDGVDLELEAGEVHGLVGENGAGKSTLMKLLAGAYADYEGELRIDGAVRRFASPADARAHGIAMVHQELSTFPHLTVTENIFGPRLPKRRGFVSFGEAHRIARAHLAELGLDIDVTSRMSTLPVGRQQLVEIARVIFSGARVIILDEPTSALSPPETRRLFDFVRTLKAQGKSLVFISHFLEDVLEISNRVTVLKNGRLSATLRANETNKHALVELMIGADSTSLNRIYEDDSRRAIVSTGSTPRRGSESVRRDVLRVEGLSKRGVFEDVTFSVGEGEILGCFAFMGAGQTELARCLFGADRADKGSVRVGGEPVRLTSTTRARAAGIAFVPEDRRSALMMPREIYKNITIAHLRRLLPFFFKESRELGIAERLMKSVGVRPPNARLPVHALSGGNQQKVVLAKWLTCTPRVLILNEPTRGMDVGAKEEVLGVVERLRSEGVATLLISTEPETVLSLADRVLVMRRGRITAELAGAQLNKEALMRNA